jgi:hypothetical protein
MYSGSEHLSTLENKQNDDSGDDILDTSSQRIEDI